MRTHRIRVAEKRVLKRVLYAIGLVIGLMMLSIYVGLPLLAKIIVFFSGFRATSTTANTTVSTLLFPPTLNPTFEATNSAKISISGFADKDIEVKIFVNEGDEQKTKSDSEGKFYVKNIALSEGENKITAVTLQSGKISDPSTPLVVVYKKTPPKLENISPKDGDSFKEDEKDITISGETDPDSKVIINDRFVIVDSQGKFSYRVTLSDGDNEYKINSVDIAGNEITQNIKLHYSP